MPWTQKSRKFASPLQIRSNSLTFLASIPAHLQTRFILTFSLSCPMFTSTPSLFSHGMHHFPFTPHLLHPTSAFNEGGLINVHVLDCRECLCPRHPSSPDTLIMCPDYHFIQHPDMLMYTNPDRSLPPTSGRSTHPQQPWMTTKMSQKLLSIF